MSKTKGTKGSEILSKLKLLLSSNENELDAVKSQFKTNLRIEINGSKFILNSMHNVIGRNIGEIEKSYSEQKDKLIKTAILVKNNIISKDIVAKDFNVEIKDLDLELYYDDLITSFKVLNLNKNIATLNLDIESTNIYLIDESEKKEMLTIDILSRYN